MVRNHMFSTFRKRPPVDPNPGSLTAEERQSVADSLAAGKSGRAHITRKAMRLSDERLVKLQRIERVVAQAEKMPLHYPGKYLAGIIGKILSGVEED